MNLSMIEVDHYTAQKELYAYQRMMKEKITKEDEQIIAGYKAALRGRKMVSLVDAVKRGGADPVTHLPRIAIARADCQYVRGLVNTEGEVEFNSELNGQVLSSWSSSGMRRAIKAGRFHRFPSDTVPRLITAVRGTALVPVIPPRFRPAVLTPYHILFEAEWKKVPPVDPALLKHVGGDLYAVLAVWELTEVERAVLAGRFAG